MKFDIFQKNKKNLKVSILIHDLHEPVSERPFPTTRILSCD